MLTGAGNYVYSLAFTPDGANLVAGSTDATVRLWDVRNPNAPIPIAVLHAASPVFSVGISPDNRTIAAGLADGAVRLWPVDANWAVSELCGTSQAVLSVEEWQALMPDHAYGDPCDPAFPDEP